jgi:hypothetical protein
MLKIGNWTINKIIHEDMDKITRKKTKVHMLSDKHKKIVRLILESYMR